MKRIVFQNTDKTIGIIIPSPEALSKYTIEQIANKDVAYGLQWKIVATSDVPSDRTFRNAWELAEDTVFDGVGSESNEFPKEEIIEELPIQQEEETDDSNK